MACSKRSYDPVDRSDNEGKRAKAVIDLEHLKCRICLQFPKEGMFMCSNGHSVCSECISKLTTCPTCRVPFPSGSGKKRNHCLDEILSKMRFDCLWKKEGCTQEGLSHHELLEHKKLCIFSPSPIALCRLLSYSTCDYEISPQFLTNSSLGIPVDFMEHLKNVHCTKSTFKAYCGKRWTNSWSEMESWRESGSAVIISDIYHLPEKRKSQNLIGLVMMAGFIDTSDAENKTSWLAVLIPNQPHSGSVSLRLTLKGSSTPTEAGVAPNLEISWNAPVISFRDYCHFMEKPVDVRKKTTFSIPWSHIQQFYLNEEKSLDFHCTFSVSRVNDSSSG